MMEHSGNQRLHKEEVLRNQTMSPLLHISLLVAECQDQFLKTVDSSNS